MRVRRLGGVGGEGVSVNIILGPGPSSVATRVMGTGLLENLGWEVCREIEGRSERTDEGRVLEDTSAFGVVLSGSWTEAGLLAEPSELAFIEVDRLEIEDGFWLGVSVCVKVRSGAETEGGAALAEAALVVSHDFLGVRSGTLISFSPVDFFDGGGPLMLSP